jgi:hypothetical protein
MNAVTTTEPVSAQTLEHVLGTGDLSKLTTQQRVEYYAKTCESLGLNPLTRPMRFLSLNGQIQLYFTRDGTDQLRKAQGITLHVVDKLIEAGLFTVTVRARAKDGREDEDIGAVVLPQSGESRANALMKAMTKAKRRVTLSICGLGQTDESELDTMPGARVFDAEDELPVAPIREQMNRDVPLRAAAAPTPRGARVAERVPAYEAGRRLRADEIAPGVVHGDNPKYADIYAKHNIAIELLDESNGNKWVSNLEMLLTNATSQATVVVIAGHPSVGTAVAKAPDHVKRRVNELLADAYARFPDEDEPTEEELGEVEIAGEDKVMAG